MLYDLTVIIIIIIKLNVITVNTRVEGLLLNFCMGSLELIISDRSRDVQD